MSISAFQKDDFDPKKWINDELAGVSKDVLENTVNSLSLKLQVLGNEVNTSFEDHIMQSLAKLPISLIDLERMSREVTQLSTSLDSMLTSDVIQKQEEAENATKTIAKLHETKTNLDMCQDTLSKTVYLRENVGRMEKAFADGDTAQIASEIHEMQQALQAIRGFDHYDQLASSVAEYEAKLQNMVEVECVEALMNRDKEKAQQHLATLRTIGRLGEILVQYTKQAVQPLVNEWRTFSEQHPINSPNWEAETLAFLPKFNSNIEQELAVSRKYYQSVFDEEALMMTLEWFTMAQKEVVRPQSAYYAAMSLQGLVASYKGSLALISAIKTNHLQNATQEQLVLLNQAASGPFNHLQQIYEQLEEKRLLSLISTFKFVIELGNERSVTINPSLVNDVNQCTTEILKECQVAIERCIMFSEGQTLPLIASLNGVLKVFSNRILEIVNKLRTALSLDGVPRPEGTPYAAEEPVKLKLSLQMYHTAVNVGTKVELFQSWLNDYVSGLKKDSVSNNLKRHIEATHTSLFADATAELSQMAKVVETVVFDLLFDAVRSRLVNVSAMPLWKGKEEVRSGPMRLSGTPGEYLTGIGDYLLGLPEALAQASISDNDDDDHRWVTMILTRSAEAFVEEIGRIPRLSDTGYKQLSTDVDYLENVMAAFEFEVPSLAVLVALTSAADPEAYDALLPGVTSMAPNGAQLHAMIAAKRAPSAADEDSSSTRATPSPPVDSRPHSPTNAQKHN